MTGRGHVVVLWDLDHDPPSGSVLDAAALATAGWDWDFYGPETLVQPPTMVVHRGVAADVPACLRDVDVVIGLATPWTLGHVARAGVRFVAVVQHDAVEGDDGEGLADDVPSTVHAWPRPDRWPDVLDQATVLAPDHIRVADTAETVACELRDLLDEIRARHLPALFRTDE